MNKPFKHPAPDYEDYVGSEIDGCHVKVWKCEDGTWRNEVIADSDTGHFVDTIGECDGFKTETEAMRSGKDLGAEWCTDNEIDFSCGTCGGEGEIYDNHGDIHGNSTTSEPCTECSVHREIDCPVCNGPLCELDGDGPNPPNESEEVFVLLYEHKHGSDVSVYRTRDGAVASAYGIACNRVEEDRWNEGDDGEGRAKFEAFEDLEAAIDFFNTTELEWSYGESLEIRESQLGD